MNNTDIEREIINALEINSNVDWDSAELTPNEEFKELTKLVRKLFKEYWYESTLVYFIFICKL